jgi:hypothetical protein
MSRSKVFFPILLGAFTGIFQSSCTSHKQAPVEPAIRALRQSPQHRIDSNDVQVLSKHGVVLNDAQKAALKTISTP